MEDLVQLIGKKQCPAHRTLLEKLGSEYALKSPEEFVSDQVLIRQVAQPAQAQIQFAYCRHLGISVNRYGDSLIRFEGPSGWLLCFY